MADVRRAIGETRQLEQEVRAVKALQTRLEQQLAQVRCAVVALERRLDRRLDREERPR